MTRAVQEQDDRRRDLATQAAAEPVVEELSPDDDAWITEAPSATLGLDWIEDDLQKTPVDEVAGAEPTGRIPAAPEMKLTPPPASRKPIRRPVVERIRPRAELIEASRVAPPRPVTRRPPIMVVSAAPAPSRRGLYLAYAGAVVAGIASGLAVLLLGHL